ACEVVDTGEQVLQAVSVPVDGDDLDDAAGADPQVRANPERAPGSEPRPAPVSFIGQEHQAGIIKPDQVEAAFPAGRQRAEAAEAVKRLDRLAGVIVPGAGTGRIERPEDAGPASARAAAGGDEQVPLPGAEPVQEERLRVPSEADRLRADRRVP